MLIKIFVLWTVLGSLSKLLFLLVYHSLFSIFGIRECLAVLGHGLLLDIAIAGYLSVLPGIMLAFSSFYSGKPLRWAWHTYFFVTSFAVSLAYVSNLGLYAYWGFPLDNTPLLYIRTSPSAAFASMSVWQILFIPIIIIVLALVVYKVMPRLPQSSANGKCLFCVILILLSVAMIIPIRGGFGTGTNHTGSVYFSQDMRLNHAAVNPIFCFVESVVHQEELSTRYRFMEDKKAGDIFSLMKHTQLRPDAVKKDYNVVLVCLESFSKYIMTEAGHVSGVTPNLDRYSCEGIYFTNFYANSFRTDRALVSVLSGIPAPPTMSIMDIPRISTSLPSIARILGEDGYSTHFYYGGDTNFSNMKSYIVGAGFHTVTSQYEFDSKLHTGKWGVADEPVYNRILNDIKLSPQPFFKVFMTSSSHEPFDVPNYKKLTSPELNAFSYADYCLGKFIESLKTLPCWKNTLVVIVSDHLGAYPLQVDNYQRWRYELPLIVLGGMITHPRQIHTVGSQIDICATLLAMLGRPHEDFTYSKDLLDESAPHFAIFSFPDAIGMVENDNFIFFDNTSKSVVKLAGSSPSALLPKAKAYLQKLYDDLGAR